MTTGPDPLRTAAQAITTWLSDLGIADGEAELRQDVGHGSEYEVRSRQAPGRWPLQVGPAQLRGELQWPDGVELHVVDGQRCRLREGDAVLPWPFDNDHNDAWWEELGQAPRPVWPG